MKSKLAVGFAFALGAITGIGLSRPSVIHAQSGSRMVTVKKVVPLGIMSQQTVAGTVVGFSCTHDNEGKPDCYIVSQ